MRSDEIKIDEPLVARLITKQFPQWSDRAITRVAPTGTDKTITPAAAVMESQNFKVPHLRNLYQKTSLLHLN